MKKIILLLLVAFVSFNVSAQRKKVSAPAVSISAPLTTPFVGEAVVTNPYTLVEKYWPDVVHTYAVKFQVISTTASFIVQLNSSANTINPTWTDLNGNGFNETPIGGVNTLTTLFPVPANQYPVYGYYQAWTLAPAVYTYKVASVDTSGNQSAWSSEHTFTIPK